MSNSIPAPSVRYAICRYPTTLIDIWRNKRGELFVLRPVLPQDKPLLQEFFSSLSPLSRRMRFHGAVNTLSPTTLNYLSEIDYDKHLALVVTVVSEGVETIVADARYVIDPSQRGGEFAIAVSDVWQRRGIAEHAMSGLCKAATLRGLDRLWGDVLGDNRAMLGLMHKTGFYQSTAGVEWGLVRVVRNLANAPALVNTTKPGPLGFLSQWLVPGRSHA
ncbi:MAG: GNAT family N-acetyltransferase [Acidobacteriota bacterium]